MEDIRIESVTKYHREDAIKITVVLKDGRKRIGKYKYHEPDDFYVLKKYHSPGPFGLSYFRPIDVDVIRRMEEEVKRESHTFACSFVGELEDE